MNGHSTRESARWIKLAAHLGTRKCIPTRRCSFSTERKRIGERRKAEIGRKLKGGEQGIGDVVERRGGCLSRELEGETVGERYTEIGQSRGKIRGEWKIAARRESWEEGGITSDESMVERCGKKERRSRGWIEREQGFERKWKKLFDSRNYRWN